MSTYVLRDHGQGYFRGLFNGEDVVWTWEQSRAMRFRDRDLAELAQVGHAPNASVVRLTKKRKCGCPAAGHFKQCATGRAALTRSAPKETT